MTKWVIQSVNGLNGDYDHYHNVDRVNVVEIGAMLFVKDQFHRKRVGETKTTSNGFRFGFSELLSISVVISIHFHFRSIITPHALWKRQIFLENERWWAQCHCSAPVLSTLTIILISIKVTLYSTANAAIVGWEGGIPIIQCQLPSTHEAMQRWTNEFLHFRSTRRPNMYPLPPY